jgi:hypothetical protein
MEYPETVGYMAPHGMRHLAKLTVMSGAGPGPVLARTTGFAGAFWSTIPAQEQ